MKCVTAALLVALALPASAVAAPAPSDPRLHQEGIPSGSLGVPPHLGDRPVPSDDLRAPDQRDESVKPDASVTPFVPDDLRAPDQRNVPTVPSPVPAPGTDVAAPDQQAPLDGPRIVVTPAPADSTSDIDWGDAGLGAAFGLGLIALSAGAALAVRRRTRRTSALAG